MAGDVASWSELPKDLLQLIFKKSLLSDHPSFMSVCTFWRSVGLQNNLLGVKFVGLVVPGETVDSETRRLLQPTLVESKYYYHNDINPINILLPHRCYCCGSGFGWLVLIDDSFDMHLFNPLSNSKIQLPSVSIAKNLNKYHVSKAFLSCSPLSSPSQTFVLIICLEVLAFCKLGNKTWTCIKPTARIDFPFCTDAIYYRHKFYMVCNPGSIVTININANVDRPTVTEYAPVPPGEKFVENRYLVESKGELFQVRRTIHGDNEAYYCSESDCEHKDGYANDNMDTDNSDSGSITCKVKIFKLKHDDGPSDRRVKWKKVKSIGDRAFFIGYNGSFSVSASDVLGCRPNLIYFTDDGSLNLSEPIRHDIGVFKVDEERIEEIYPTNSQPMRPPPFWFAPFL